MSGSTRAITPMTLSSGSTRRGPRSCSATTSPCCAPSRTGASQMAYPDPPFNTGRDADPPHARHDRGRRRTATAPASAGAATPRRAARASPPTATRSTTTSASSRRAWREVRRLLHPTGTLYLHLDYREAHYVQAAARRAVRPRVLPQRADLGLRLRRQAAPPLAAEARHDPRLRQGPARATTSTPRRSTASPTWRPGWSRRRRRARGKRPTDVMWHTIVSPTGREKTGYPTQKPEGLLRRFVQASSRARRPLPGPVRRLGDARRRRPRKLGRRYLLMDASPEAVAVATKTPATT